MSNNIPQTYNFLTLHATLARVISFAETNEYIYPPISQTQVNQFYSSMSALFTLSEQLQVLPYLEQKQTFELAASYYAQTKNCLVTLFMSSPSPSQAKGWFDYQKEFKAREQYQKDLMVLMTWHLDFFEELVQRAPPLIIPALTEALSHPELPQQEDAVVSAALPDQDLFL